MYRKAEFVRGIQDDGVVGVDGCVRLLGPLFNLYLQNSIWLSGIVNIG